MQTFLCLYATGWADSVTLYKDFKSILAESKFWAPQCPKSYQRALREAPHKRQIEGKTYGLFLNCSSRKFDENTRVTGTRYHRRAKIVIQTETQFREIQLRLIDSALRQIADLDRESKGEVRTIKTAPDKWYNWGERIEMQYANSRIRANFDLGLMREITTPDNVFYESETIDFVKN